MKVTAPEDAEGVQQIGAYVSGDDGNMEANMGVEPCWEPIPTLTQWGALILILFMGAGAFWKCRRRKRTF